ESAFSKKIDTRRVNCIIMRQAGNPLSKFEHLAAGLSRDSVSIRNINALLLTGPQGEKIKGKLTEAEAGSDLISITVGVSNEGEMKAVDADSSDLTEVLIKINISGSPAEEYVKSASFYPGTSELIRQKILGA